MLDHRPPPADPATGRPPSNGLHGGPFPALEAEALRRYAHGLLLSICHRCPYERALALRAWVRAACLPGWDVGLRVPRASRSY